MTEAASVWVVDDDKSIRWVLEKALAAADLSCRSFADGESLIAALDKDSPEVVISDLRMPGISGMDLLARLQQLRPLLPVVITTAHSDLDSAVNSYQQGAFEYLPKPFDVDDMVAVVRRALEHSRQHQARGEQEQTLSPDSEIIGRAPAMQEVFRAIGRLVNSTITVLINGESGTGKELVAKALHRHSPRAEKPFIALNMAAIPRDLLESELFGHERGAFTGANTQRAGRFEQADGGTLFLDEIGDMPADTQTRLLRVLADGEFYRVGGHTPVRVDVRIIAATHQDLEARVERGEFREDLFHRLNVIRIHLPGLARRREDIPLLARHFLNRAADELGVEAKQLLPETEALLCELPWRGNVRQLENTCRWLTVMAPGREVQPGDLPAGLLREQAPEQGVKTDSCAGASWQDSLAVWAEKALNEGAVPLLKVAQPEFERVMMAAALKATGGRKHEAAALLGWGRNTLTRKLKALDEI